MSGIASASDSPVIQGRNARVNGQGRETCPHPEGSEDRAAWLQAWDQFGDDNAAEASKEVPKQDNNDPPANI